MTTFYDDDRFGHIHLQWFASEDEGRTEDPTEQKLREARKDGKVAKSQEITSSVIMLFSLLILGILSRYMLNIVIDMLNFFITKSTEPDMLLSGQLLPVFFNYFLKLSLPIMGAAFFAAGIGNLMQVGFLFTTKTITPDFQKISPNIIKWAQKSFFSMEGFFNIAKSILKVIIIGAIAFLNIRREFGRLTYSVNISVLENFRYISGIAFRLLIQGTIVMLALSVPDFLFQRYQHKESLKMTKHEVKEEMKQSEGDPMIKSRLKQRMQEIMSSNMIQNVETADVVITNPTHYAIALEYDRAKMEAPQVTAKGQDQMALRIREMAEQHDVPIVENKPLARGLFRNVEIGDTVPQEYWEVVSLILSEVYRMNGKAV